MRGRRPKTHARSRLRPGSFRYKPEIDPSGLRQYGLIAEEVAQVDPDLVACRKGGEGLSPHFFAAARIQRAAIPAAGTGGRIVSDQAFRRVGVRRLHAQDLTKEV